MIDKFQRTREEAVVAYFKIVPLPAPGGTDKHNITLQPQ